MNNINLLLKKDEEKLNKKRQLRFLNIIAFTSILIVGLLSIIIFLFISGVNSGSLKKQEEDTLRKITSLKDKHAKLFILKYRIKNIAEILNAKKDLPKKSSTLIGQMPRDLSIGNLNIDEKTTSISFSADSLSDIARFIDNLVSLAKRKELISSLTLSYLIFDDIQNTYSVSLKADLL